MVRKELLEDEQKLKFIEVLLIVGAILSALNIPMNMVWYLMLFIMAGLFIFVNIQAGIKNIHLYNYYVGITSLCFSAVFTYLFASSFIISFSIRTPISEFIIIVYLFGLAYFFNRILSKPTEGRIMWKKIKNSIKEFFSKFWYVIVIIGLIAIISTIILEYHGFENSIVYFTITLGISLISIGLACYSIFLSDISDRKMSAISNELVLRIISEYEDRRLSLLRRKRELYHKIVNNTVNSTEKQLFKTDFNFIIWKCVVDMRKIKALKDFINEDQQKTLLRWSYNLFNNICYHVRQHTVIDLLPNGKQNKRIFKLAKLSAENKNHFRAIMDILITLDEYENDDALKEKINGVYERLQNL